MASNSTTGAGEKTWFGHPRQLARLFTTEMWERFGYYGMRALLVLYLAQHFLFDDQTTNGLYGAFTSLVYLTPLFGGLIADRYLGAKRSVKLGAILMCVGYLGLCFGGEQAKPFFNHAGQRYEVQVAKDATGRSVQSVVTTAGTYAIKGNDDGTSRFRADGSVLPQTIAKGEFESDARAQSASGSRSCCSRCRSSSSATASSSPTSRRSSARSMRRATAAAMRASRSSTWASTSARSAARSSRRSLRNGSAGGRASASSRSAWLIAWSLFQFDGGRLKGYGEPPADVGEKSRLYVYLGALAAIPVAWFLLNNAMLSAQAAHAAASEGTGIIGYLAALPLLGKVLFGLFVAAVIGIPIWAARVGTREEFEKMVVAIVLVVISVVFWTLFEQAGSCAHAVRRTQHRSPYRLRLHHAGGPGAGLQPDLHRPAGAALRVLWIELAKRNLEPSIPVKFAIALVLVGLGFLVAGVRRAVSRTPSSASAHLAGAALSDPLDRRALPLAGRPFDDHQALDRADRRPDDGRLVPRRPRWRNMSAAWSRSSPASRRSAAR